MNDQFGATAAVYIIRKTTAAMVDDGSFANAAYDLIPLHLTLLQLLQREIITKHLLRVEPDWP